MKKQFLIATLLLVAFLPASLLAQTAIDKLYEKYAGKEGFTSINISPEMFSMLGNINTDDSTGDVQDAKMVMEQLKGLKMLAYEPKPDAVTNDKEAFMKEVRKTIPLDEYAELMAIREDGSDIRFLVRKNSGNRISEMLMIIDSDTDAMIMSLTGDIDMNTISKIGKTMNMKGMENLDKLDQK